MRPVASVVPSIAEQFVVATVTGVVHDAAAASGATRRSTASGSRIALTRRARGRRRVAGTARITGGRLEYEGCRVNAHTTLPRSPAAADDPGLDGVRGAARGDQARGNAGVNEGSG